MSFPLSSFCACGAAAPGSVRQYAHAEPAAVGPVAGCVRDLVGCGAIMLNFAPLACLRACHRRALKQHMQAKLCPRPRVGGPAVPQVGCRREPRALSQHAPCAARLRGGSGRAKRPRKRIWVLPARPSGLVLPQLRRRKCASGLLVKLRPNHVLRRGELPHGLGGPLHGREPWAGPLAGPSCSRERKWGVKRAVFRPGLARGLLRHARRVAALSADGRPAAG